VVVKVPRRERDGAAPSRPAAAASGDEGHESLQDCRRKLVQLLPQVTRGIRRSQTPPTAAGAKLGPRHGALTVGALAARLGLTLPTTSGIVADVEKAGFVLRTPDPTDRRRTIVWLDGAALLKAMTFLQAELNDGEKALDATGRDRQQP
jgi:hypothetical protein